MKNLKFIFVGILFGIVMTKSEAVSWFRIQEMFRFESFHMYGIIGVTVLLGILMIYIMKRKKMNNIDGATIEFKDKQNSISRYLIGGIIFGMGWAMTGACPGPIFTLLGHGVLSMIIVIISAVFGTLLYGLVKEKLPH